MSSNENWARRYPDLTSSRGGALRELLARPEILVLPGVYDPISALLAHRAGFEGVYISGSATATVTAGLPDLSLINQMEIARATQYISQAIPLPIVVDGDTGHGTALATMRTVREFERAGAGGIHLEDQVMPKRCGHLEGKEIVSIEEMEGKLRAAVFARSDPNLVIIARTDSKGVEGFDRAVERARRYVASGADAIFPEALETEEEFKAFAREVRAPLLANMTEFGKTPYFSAEQFQDWGYKMVLFPVSALRVAMKVVFDFYGTLKKNGTQRHWVPRMMTRKELYEVIDYDGHEDLERMYSSGAET